MPDATASIFGLGVPVAWGRSSFSEEKSLGLYFAGDVVGCICLVRQLVMVLFWVVLLAVSTKCFG
jgi:hypothetical protein